MNRPFEVHLRWLAAVALVHLGEASPAPACAAELADRQCSCVIRPLETIVRNYLAKENGVPQRWGWGNLTVTTRYFVLGTLMDPTLPVPPDQQLLFPAMDRFRVDASWARPPVLREIGRTMNVSYRHGICEAARYRVGQQYLLHIGFAGDTLVNLIACGVVHPSDSARTRAAIAVLDSALKRR